MALTTCLNPISAKFGISGAFLGYCIAISGAAKNSVNIVKHPTIAPPLFQLIQNIPGMRDGFEIGTWHKIIGGKCDEASYIFQMRDYFTHAF